MLASVIGIDNFGGEPGIVIHSTFRLYIIVGMGACCRSRFAFFGTIAISSPEIHSRICIFLGEIVLKTNIVAINVIVNHQRFAHDVDYIRAAVYQNSGCRGSGYGKSSYSNSSSLYINYVRSRVKHWRVLDYPSPSG
jgi:hypothetical protein